MLELSAFGERFAGDTGVMQLMEDLDEALEQNPDMLFMGGGNPARIAAVEGILRDTLHRMLDDTTDAYRLLGLYQSPGGDRPFREALATLLRSQYGWPIESTNIALANGSQSAFFTLFNLLAGEMPDGSHRQIRLPLVPEYVGYTDIGLSDHLFCATKPAIDLVGDQQFRYQVDFDALSAGPADAAWCLSRPTNPSGNVISDDALARLDSLATSHGIPLIIDGAYGLPFPSMVYTDSNAYWSPNVILMLTLSKLGLPALRTGIIVAREDIVDRFNRASTVMNLATGSFGPVLGARLLQQGLLDRIARDHVGPFYRARSVVAQDSLLPEISGLPCRIHCPDGAMFLWLWCQNLPGGATALYQRLKARGVLVVPGSHFFPGIVDPWAHRDECIRISYAQDDDTIRRGMAVIGDEVRKTYQLPRSTPQQENI